MLNCLDIENRITGVSSMRQCCKILITLVYFVSASIAFAQPPINMGAIGDSLTDEYLPPDPGVSRTHTDLAAHSWLEILAQTRAAYINFGPYKVPGPDGSGWGDRREFGYELNFAKAGGAASRTSEIKSGSVILPIDSDAIKSAYGDTQALGLASEISQGKVGLAYVGLGANDFFYQTYVFDTQGNWYPRSNWGFDTTDPAWQDAIALDVSNSMPCSLDE